MPLKKGSSKAVIAANVKELMKAKPSKARKKGIATIAKRKGITKRKAEQEQAVAIALTKAGKSKRKSRKAKKRK
jgi:hypothetical protein